MKSRFKAGMDLKFWLAIGAISALMLVAFFVGAPALTAAPAQQEAPTPTLDPFFFTPTPDPFFFTPTPDPFFFTPTPDPFFFTPTPDPFFFTPTPDPFFFTPTPDPFLLTPTPDPFATPTVDPSLPPPAIPDSSGVLTSTEQLPQEPPPPPPVTSLTIEQVRNASISVPSVGVTGAVQLVNGRFDNPETGLSIVVSDTHIALGDLNGDTAGDAALVATTSQAGARTGTDLIVLSDQAGVPVQLAAFPLGDSVNVDRLRVERGAVWVDMQVAGPGDEPCCPTLPLKRIYVVRGDQLLELPAASFGRLFPYRYANRYGYVNVLGEFVVPPQFAFAGDFSEGMALVSTDGAAYGFINRLGDMVIPEQYQFATPFDGGVAVAGLSSETTGASERALFIDREGNNVFGDQTFVSAQPFREGMAAVKTEEGKFGFIDRAGALVIPAAFDFALPFSEGLAPVILGDKVGYVDRRGVTVIDPQYDAGDSFSEGLAAVAISGTVGYIDHSGKFTIEPQFERAERFVDGLALAVREGQESFIDTSGAPVFSETTFSSARRFSEGRAAAKVDGLFGYLDPAGALAIAPQFTVAGPFDNGLAVVESADNWGVISYDGTWYVQLSLGPRAQTQAISGTVPGSASPGTPGTQTVSFVPAVPDEIRSGACYTGSDIVPLPTAWRCGADGGEVFDPCILAGDGETVVCNADPTTGEPGFALDLTQPLPAAGVEGKDHPGAWIFQLESGEICRYNMGASITIGDERIAYSCSNLTQLLGEIDKTTPLWTIDAVTTESNGEGGLDVTSRTPLTIVRTWLPGVVPAQ